MAASSKAIEHDPSNTCFFHRCRIEILNRSRTNTTASGVHLRKLSKPVEKKGKCSRVLFLIKTSGYAIVFISKINQALCHVAGRLKQANIGKNSSDLFSVLAEGFCCSWFSAALSFFITWH